MPIAKINALTRSLRVSWVHARAPGSVTTAKIADFGADQTDEFILLIRAHLKPVISTCYSSSTANPQSTMHDYRVGLTPLTAGVAYILSFFISTLSTTFKKMLKDKI